MRTLCLLIACSVLDRGGEGGGRLGSGGDGRLGSGGGVRLVSGGGGRLGSGGGVRLGSGGGGRWGTGNILWKSGWWKEGGVECSRCVQNLTGLQMFLHVRSSYDGFVTNGTMEMCGISAV